MLLNKNRLTKFRSRQAVKPLALQPVVMLTAHWPAFLGTNKWKLQESLYIQNGKALFV